MTPDELGRRFHDAIAGGDELASPGSGRTASRFAALWAAALDDLALARLIEAHHDAIAILRESGRTPHPDVGYAVWASESSVARVRAEPVGDAWRLHGDKRFCSGVGHVGRALITADTPEGSSLFELPVVESPGTLHWDTSTWRTDAFGATLTGTLHLDGAEVPADARIGEPGWYVARPGFWHGAIGVAACWAGGAAAIVAAHDLPEYSDPHRLAHAGAMRADVWEMRAVLERAASEIDADPTDRTGAGIARALAVRFVVERAASDVLRRFGASAGPAPRVFDADLARRCAELQLYLLQSHAERDLELLGNAPARSLAGPPGA